MGSDPVRVFVKRGLTFSVSYGIVKLTIKKAINATLIPRCLDTARDFAGKPAEPKGGVGKPQTLWECLSGWRTEADW